MVKHKDDEILTISRLDSLKSQPIEQNEQLNLANVFKCFDQMGAWTKGRNYGVDQ